MWIEASDIACSVLPGQFITVRCGDFTLRRPFSVHQVSSREIALLFKVAGKGTLWLSQRETGDRIDILGPLGKGFSIPPTKSRQSKHLLLVAGGIGIAPLVLLTQHASSQHQITLIQGASTAAQLYPFPSATSKKQSKLPHLPNGVQYVPITEDGSMGQKGRATDILPDFLEWADQVYACGPLDMYKAMAEMSWPAKQSNLKLKKCQVSLEVRMGCGFGVCYGCTINTKKGLKQVCRDGPVFELDDIIWQEVRI
jgi:dihydroorotate dehydrogenase electron transfer subunit